MAISLASLNSTTTLKPPRILIHGVHGVGKTTFVAGAPDPVFVLTEDGLGTLDVPHFPPTRTLDEVMQWPRSTPRSTRSKRWSSTASTCSSPWFTPGSARTRARARSSRQRRRRSSLATRRRRRFPHRHSENVHGGQDASPARARGQAGAPRDPRRLPCRDRPAARRDRCDQGADRDRRPGAPGEARQDGPALVSQSTHRHSLQASADRGAHGAPADVAPRPEGQVQELPDRDPARRVR